MPAMEGRPSPHRWNQIKQLALFADVQTLDQYEQAVIRGGAEALVYLRSIDSLAQLTVADLQQVHRLMFRRVHPWAGQFRRPGQMAIVAGFPAADAQRITRELSLASCQMRELLERALVTGDPHQILTALAFFHIRFERVHPFLDGNGRVGRAILSVQFEKVFGVLPKFAYQGGYRLAMRAADRRDLAPLTNYLGASAELRSLDHPWPSPFQVSPRFLEEAEGNPTFQADLAWSRIVR